MISIKQLNDYFTDVVTRSQGIKSMMMISSEADFGLAIRNLSPEKFPAMLLIIPSADSVAPTTDSVSEVTTCLVYIIQKVEASDQTPASFVDVISVTQELMTLVKWIMLGDKGLHGPGHITHDINLNGMHTDPEYNFFGCHGWSLSFTIVNPGF